MAPNEGKMNMRRGFLVTFSSLVHFTDCQYEQNKMIHMRNILISGLLWLFGVLLFDLLIHNAIGSQKSPVNYVTCDKRSKRHWLKALPVKTHKNLATNKKYVQYKVMISDLIDSETQAELYFHFASFNWGTVEFMLRNSCRYGMTTLRSSSDRSTPTD